MKLVHVFASAYNLALLLSETQLKVALPNAAQLTSLALGLLYCFLHNASFPPFLSF